MNRLGLLYLKLFHPIQWLSDFQFCFFIRKKNKIVFIAGRVDDRNGEIKIVADDVQEILVPKEA